MNETILAQITEQWQGKSVGEYLKKELHLTAAQVSSLKFQENGICRNGKKCRTNQILCQGDQLEIRLHKSQAEKGKVEASGRMPEILYEDRDVICVWKPSGRVTHPVAGHKKDTIAGDLVSYFSSKGEQTVIHSIGRLDKDTEGILVFAKNRIAAARLWQQREEGTFYKEYLAWCQGEFEEKEQKEEQTVCVSIGKAASVPGKGQTMQADASGKRAVTHYQVLRQEKELALVRFHLETGRTHQIRVHMAYIGHPLAGDSLYGNGVTHQDAAKLCAWKVRFLQPFTKKEIILEHQTPLWSISSCKVPK